MAGQKKTPFERIGKELGYTGDEAWCVAYKKGRGFIPMKVHIDCIKLYPSGVAIAESIGHENIYKTREEAERHCKATRAVNIGGLMLTWEEE